MFLVQLIVFIINLLFQTGMYHKSFQDWTVKHLYKSWNKKCMNNIIYYYRPIQFTKIISKVLQNCIKNVLIEFFNTHKIIDEFRFVCQKNMSTNNAPLDVTQHFYNNLDNGLKCVCSKRVWTVSQCLFLMQKLELCGVKILVCNCNRNRKMWLH